jgi:hypothetical protein
MSTEEHMIQVCEVADYSLIELYFIEHCKIDTRKSVLGWLLTLNDGEFEEAALLINKDESLLPLLVLTDCSLVEGISLNKKELDKVTTKLKGAVSLTSGIRQNKIGFRPKEKDEDWEFFKI